MRTTIWSRMSAVVIALLAAACGGKAEVANEGADVAVAGPDDGTPATSSGSETQAPARPERVAGDVGVPTALAVGADRVLFTTGKTKTTSGDLASAGGLFLVYKTLGRPLLLSLDAKGASYDALAIDGEHAYVATSDARLFRAPISGGAESPVADLASPARALTVAGEYVYLATDGGIVERVAKSGVGAIEPVGTVAGRPLAVSVDEAGAVYVATAATGKAGGAIVKIAERGAEPVALTTPSATPCAMTREGRELFFTASGSVHRLSVEGGAESTIAAGPDGACAIATDGRSLWVASGGVGLLRAPIEGGVPAVVTDTTGVLATPGTVAVDDAHVYWLDANAVLRVAKPTR